MSNFNISNVITNYKRQTQMEIQTTNLIEDISSDNEYQTEIDINLLNNATIFTDMEHAEQRSGQTTNSSNKALDLQNNSIYSHVQENVSTRTKRPERNKRRIVPLHKLYKLGKRIQVINNFHQQMTQTKLIWFPLKYSNHRQPLKKYRVNWKQQKLLSNQQQIEQDFSKSLFLIRRSKLVFSYKK